MNSLKRSSIFLTLRCLSSVAQRGNCAGCNSAAESESQRVADDRRHGCHYYLQSSRR